MIFYRHPNPFKLPRIEFDSTTSEKLLRNQIADEISDGQAVRLARLVNRVGGDRLPAPVTLSTTTVGLPGIYLLICRPMIREYVSKPPPAGNPTPIRMVFPA